MNIIKFVQFHILMVQDNVYLMAIGIHGNYITDRAQYSFPQLSMKQESRLNILHMVLGNIYIL